MTRVVVPNGPSFPTLHRASPDPLAGNRVTRYRFDLLDNAGKKFGELDGVSSGGLEWSANSQIKGGGRIVVSKANSVHKREIRVARNHPVVEEADFETDTDGFKYIPIWIFEPPTSITRDTSVFYEGAASLRVEWAAQTNTWGQDAVVGYSGLIPGQQYTLIARVLNTGVSTLTMECVGRGKVSVPIKADWQTVAVPFTASLDYHEMGLINAHPVAGTVTYMDSVALYEGVTSNFNGENFVYAPFSWMHARVRPVLMIDGVPEKPLGVFIPSAPAEQWSEGGGTQQIELLDRTSILSQDCVERTYSIKAGTKVISQVRRLIGSTGEKPGAISDSGRTLKSGLTWPPGTSKLTIINELLEAADFFALWTDGNGQFRVQKYVEPRYRPMKRQFLDDDSSIYIPTFSTDTDVYSIPNKVIVTAQGSGSGEGYVGIATNENPDSPYSYQNRGRWVVDTVQGIEVADPDPDDPGEGGADGQKAVNDYAKRRLRQLTSAASTSIQIQHAPIPGLMVNDVVRFRRGPAEVDGLFAVTKTSIDFDPKELAKTTLTEVASI